MSNTKTCRSGWTRFIAMLERLTLVEAVERKWLAREVGISDSTLSRYISGETEADASIAYEICRAVGGDYGKQLLQALVGDDFEIVHKKQVCIHFADANSNGRIDDEDKKIHAFKIHGAASLLGECAVRALHDGKISSSEQAEMALHQSRIDQHQAVVGM
jgi:transcriptional regulator with XRE-family HTH domain